MNVVLFYMFKIRQQNKAERDKRPNHFILTFRSSIGCFNIMPDHEQYKGTTFAITQQSLKMVICSFKYTRILLRRFTNCTDK